MRGVDQHPAHTGPEIAGRKHIFEILEPYEFIHQFAAAVSATAFGDLTEETGVDGIENRDDEYDGEQYAEWRHERPSCSILAALRFSALWFRRLRCCSHDVPIFRIGCHSSLGASFTVRIAVSEYSSRERSAGFSRSVESAKSIHREYSRGGIFVRNVMSNGAKPCATLAPHRCWRGLESERVISDSIRRSLRYRQTVVLEGIDGGLLCHREHVRHLAGTVGCLVGGFLHG